MESHPYTASLPVTLPKRGFKQRVPTVGKVGSKASPTICHVTVAHSELKSRTLYMQLAPLAAAGMPVRYLSPAQGVSQRENVTFVPLAIVHGWLARSFRGMCLLGTLLDQHADVYHVQDPELLPAAFLLRLVCGKRVVFDSYEDFASMARQSQSIPVVLKPVAEKAMLQIQKLAARSFDGVITADPLTLRRFARAGRSKKLVFYNFPNLDVFPPPVVGQQKRFDIVYRGGVSARAGTWTLLDALHELRSRGTRTKTLLIGYFDNTSARLELSSRIATLGLSDEITIEGRIDHATMPHVLGQARIGVSPLLDTPKFRRNIPVKIFEYWACGLPVVASDLPPIRPFFRSADAGLLFTPGDARGLANAVAQLLAQPKVSREMGMRGREAIENRWNNRSEVHKLYRLFTQITDSR